MCEFENDYRADAVARANRMQTRPYTNLVLSYVYCARNALLHQPMIGKPPNPRHRRLQEKGGYVEMEWTADADGWSRIR